MTGAWPVTAALAAALLAGTVHAQTMTEIRMVGFGGANNLPVRYAIDRGLFEKEGLKVSFDRTTSSPEQIADIMAGKYQFATTAIDNIVAYTQGEGAVKYDDFDIAAILGVHAGLTSVVAAPQVKTWADIRGKTVAVDAVTSGYATVLYQILQDKGIAKDRDYNILAVGGTGARVKSLKEGTAQMGMISSPEDIQLKNEGFNILADAAVEIGNYQGSVYSVRRSYAKAHEKEVLAFIRAMTAAHDAVFKNRDDAITVLRSITRGLSDQELSAIYARLTGPGGLSPGAAINTKGIETVLKLRSIYGGAKGELPSPTKFIETSYADKAKQR